MLNELCGYQLGHQHLYRRQQELNVLCKRTSFNKQEIKLLYWGWKVACPDGVLDEKILKEIYAQFFPQAGMIFKKLKKNILIIFLFIFSNSCR